jgi:hypothetical protein
MWIDVTQKYRINQNPGIIYMIGTCVENATHLEETLVTDD